MTIYYGSKEIKELYFGSQKIESLFSGNIEIPIVSTVTFTLIPDPADATVVLTAEGYTQEGNSISVAPGTTITYTVSKEGYTTQTGTQVCTINCSFNCTLLGIYTFTINPTPSDATVILTADGYTQNGNSITVAGGTTVNYVVQDINEEGINTLYSWVYGDDVVIYTKSPTPSAGDTIYTADGLIITDMTIGSYGYYGMKIQSVTDDSISITASIGEPVPY